MLICVVMVADGSVGAEDMEANFADKTVWTGDNLDILRGMNSESVDLIYLDPPFNSNRRRGGATGAIRSFRFGRSMLTMLSRARGAGLTI